MFANFLFLVISGSSKQASDKIDGLARDQRDHTHYINSPESGKIYA